MSTQHLDAKNKGKKMSICFQTPWYCASFAMDTKYHGWHHVSFASMPCGYCNKWIPKRSMGWM
jgi:hypothetical protein